MLDQSSRYGPFWLWGILLAALLILLSTRGRFAQENSALQQVFAAQPTPAGLPVGFTLPQLDLAGLPDELQALSRDLQRRLGLGEAVTPIMPSAQTARLAIELQELRRSGEEIRLLGQVRNISPAELVVPISAFTLRDSTGAGYVAGGGASARLSPGETTPLDLTVPLPAGRGLLLVTELPPDPPVEQVLLAANN